MKPLRVLLIGAGVFVVLLLALVTLAFNSSVQTWAARRALEGQSDLQGEIGRVSVGLHKIHGQDIVLRRSGMVLTLPAVDAELSVLGAAGGELSVGRLVAHGWTLDLTAPELAEAPAEARSYASVVPLPLAATSGDAKPALPIGDVLSALELPVDLIRLDGLDLEGRVIFSTVDGPATALVRITGGGLTIDQPGSFQITADTTLADGGGGAKVALDADVAALLRTPRTFARIGANVTIDAQGGVVAEPVQLRVDLEAGAGEGGASEYRLDLFRADKALLEVSAYPVPGDASQLQGKWRAEVATPDVAPFMFGMPLPGFRLTGEGTLEVSAIDGGAAVAGRVDVLADELEAILPELSAVEPIKALVIFDARRAGDDVRVTRLEADIAGARPVATLRTKQGLEFNLSTAELKIADPDSDLLDVQVHGLPLEWLQPFVHPLVVSGAPIQGTWTAGARDGGFVVRAASPLRMGGVTVSREAGLLAGPLDVALSLSGEYLPSGWQARVENGHVSGGGKRLASFDARAGQATAAGAAVVATSRFNTDIGGILAQPAAAEYQYLQSGVAVGEFIVAMSDKVEMAAEIEVANMIAVDGTSLPHVGLEVRADMAEDRRIEAHVPLRVTKDGRASDVTLDLQARPNGNGLYVDALATGRHLFVQDVQTLMVPLLARQAAEPAPEGVPDEAGVPVPIWEGLEGKLRMSFGTVVTSDALTFSNVEGEMVLGAEQVNVPQLQVSLATGGQFRLQGTLGFEPAQPEPYVLHGTVAATEVKVGELMNALSPGSTPPVEGVFDLTSNVQGRASSIEQLVDRTAVEAKLSSRGGVLRALSVTVADYAKTASTLANVAGLIGVLTGDSRAERVKAAADLANQLANLAFDQLNIEITRSPGSRIAIEDLTLISPAIRLLGSGTVGDTPGRSLWEEPLDVRLQLSARDAVAENLRILRLLKDSADTLGYLPMVEEITLQGSLGNITRSQLQSLISRALSQ